METRPRRPLRFRPGCLLAALPILAAGCCLFLLRPRDSGRAIEAAEELQSGWEDRLQGLDPEEVEAAAIDVVGGSVELGLVLGPIRTETGPSGRTHFEATLANIADFPVASPRAILRLQDAQGQLVETVTLVGDLAVLSPGGVERIMADFDPVATPPRIVEETIAFSGASSPFFGISSYEEVKRSPGFLSRVAGLLPFISYEARWTNPTSNWVSYEIQFRIERVVRD